jgi:DNA processing protein
MAVPGPVTSAMSVGCHLLLADRFAQLVTGADDVLAALGRHGQRDGSRAAEEPVPGRDPRHPTDGLDLESARVYDAFPTYAACSVEELATESGLHARDIVGALGTLEVHGLVSKHGPLWQRVDLTRT